MQRTPSERPASVPPPFALAAPEATAVEAAPEPELVPPPHDDDELDLTISDQVIDASGRRTMKVAGDDALSTAFEALQDLFFLSTPIEGLEFVMRLLDDLVPSEAASACLYDINTDEFRFVALAGPGAQERQGEAVPRLIGLLGAAAQSPGDTLVVDHVAHDDRFDPGVDGRVGLDPRNMALVAVAFQGRLLGMLQLINRRDQPEYTRADANLLAYVGEKLGEFLQAARMRPREREHA
jgi:GAF domain-containing protein